MDYRNEPRFSTNQQVRVTKLSVPGETIPGRIVNFSASGICLSVDQDFPVGTPLKVECGTSLLLGQVIYSQQDGVDFSVGMELEEAVYDTTLFKSFSDSAVVSRSN